MQRFKHRIFENKTKRHVFFFFSQTSNETEKKKSNETAQRCHNNEKMKQEEDEESHNLEKQQHTYANESEFRLSSQGELNSEQFQIRKKLND